MTARDGGISILILVIGVTSAFIMAGLLILTSTQFNLSGRNAAREQALAIAESGIDYYRWHLAHAPDDYQDGTGGPGPYVHTYEDPQEGPIGSFSLEIDPPDATDEAVTITSTGTVDAFPGISRTVRASFGIPSLAQYAFLHNSNVWFGTGMTISGPVQSNAGIRMDGVNLSTMSSTKETYTCGIESGCDPSEEKPGIWGNGGPQELWDFPVSGVDFVSINLDFNTMKTTAQNDGLYLGPSSTQGYHVVFQPDGTLDVYEVTQTDFYKGWSYTYACENLYQIIDNETLVGSYNVPDTSVIFIEDTIWVEGTLNGQTTVVAARFPIDSYQEDIWIPDNLVYLAKDGTHKLGLISQRDIIFGKDVPKTFEVNGALLAQSSRVLRHHYNYSGCKQGNPAMKNELIVYGSVISNLISYWNFGGGGGGNPTSGFVKRTITHDPNLTYDPPPSFPSSGVLELLNWEELE